jgi:protease-4
MPGMKTPGWFLLLTALAVPAGCGRNVGYLLTPVPLDQRLQETVVQKDAGWVTDKVALVDVSGLILNERGGGLFGGEENPVSLLAEKLDLARRDGHVKAVILRVDSPGGTVQATEAMHGLVERFRRESGKPVVACITNVGASGAYYLCCAAGRIICQSTSITGSIGVIVQSVSFAGTMKMVGVKADAIVSGPMKDMGSPLRDMTEKDRAVFQALVDEFYGRFLDAVAKGRANLDKDKIRSLADGRIYTGAQAVELGLADRLGDLQDALAEAKKACGAARVKVVMYDRPQGYRANVYSAAPSGTGGAGTQINLLNLQAGELMFLRRPAFLYLWSTDLTAQTGTPSWR